MNYENVVKALHVGISSLVQTSMKDLENLNANNLSLSILAMISYNVEKKSKVVDTLVQTLINKQLPNGSWLNELWGTGFALLALYKYSTEYGIQYRISYGKKVRDAVKYISLTQCKKRSNWQGELFETILLCWVFLKTDRREEFQFIKSVINRLKRFQSVDGGLFDIYDTALCLCVFHEAELVLKQDNSVAIEKGVSWLKTFDLCTESFWNRVVLLFMISEISLSSDSWTDRLVESLCEEIGRGNLPEDHDELAMLVWALSCYLRARLSDKYQIRRIPVDNINNLFEYDKSCHSFSDLLKTLINTINIKSKKIKDNKKDTPKQLFSYTDAFVKNIDSLFAPIHNIKQFESMINAFYIVIYEASGDAKRIPKSFKKDDSVVWTIKHLRNSIDHDLKHSNDKGIENAYNLYCGKIRPIGLDDYRLVHVSLLGEVTIFLEELEKYQAELI